MATSKTKSAQPAKKAAKQAKAKPAAKKTATRPAARSAAKKPAGRAPAKAAKRPAVKPAAKAAGKQSAKPAAKRAAKQVAKSVANKSSVRTTVKASKKSAVKAAQKTTARKPAAKAAKQPAAKLAQKPAVKVAKQPGARPAKPVVGKSAGKTAAKTTAKAKPRGGAAPERKKDSRAAALASTKLEHIDRKTLVQIVAKLEEMRDESRAIVNQNLHSDLKPREESSDVGDDLDQASHERDREFNLIMHQRHLRRLLQIEEAFERIDDGTYGLCEGTDEPINPRRLLIMPLARYSLEYQEQQEKMMGRGVGADGFYETGGDESFSSDDL